MRIAHTGTFDVANYGDLLFPLILEHRLADQGHEFLHVSPAGGPPVYRDGVTSIGLEEFFSDLWQTCDAYIVGGGNIVHTRPVTTDGYASDGRSSCLAYPGLWLAPAIAADSRSRPVVWNASGVSTEFHPDQHEAIRQNLAGTPYFAVRDAASRKLLQAAAPDFDVAVVPDSAFGLPDLWSQEELQPVFERLKRKSGHGRSHRFYVFHVKDRYLSSGVAPVAAGISSLCARDGAIPIVLPIGPVHGDRQLARELAGQLTVPHLLVAEIDSLREVTALLACSDLYCGSSLHGLIVSSAYHTPGIAVADRSVHKFEGFAEHLRLENVIAGDWQTALSLCASGRVPVATDAAYNNARAALDNHWNQLTAALKTTRSEAGTLCSDPLEETLRIVMPQALDILTAKTVQSLSRERTLSQKLTEANETCATARDGLKAAGPGLEVSTSQLSSRIDMIDHSRAWRLLQRLRSVLGRSDNPLDVLRSSVNDLRAIAAQVSVFTSRMEPVEEQQPQWRVEDWTASVIVCVHNAPDDVAACLQSIERHTDLTRHHLILVDDGSDPEAEEIVHAAAERLGATRIRNDVPQGYTCAANQGLRQSDSDASVLLNSDTIVTAGWLEGLIRCAQSRPKVACVGPLSNAASWQSIPDLTGSDGKWKVNSVPAGLTIDQFAEVLAKGSPQLYPETPLVNGFCYLMTRQAIETVGYLDEGTFPRGYGEEDDYSLRCQTEGLCHLIADDVYVFHAKSKSFTSPVRDQLVKSSRDKLLDKHGQSHLGGAVASMKSNEELLVSRVSARLAVKRSESRRVAVSRQPQRIGWILPGPTQPDGTRCAVEITGRLAAAGHEACLISGDGSVSNSNSGPADIVTLSEAQQTPFDVLICTSPDSASLGETLTADQRVYYHVSRYSDHLKAGHTVAAFYSSDSNIIHLANSKELAEFVNDRVSTHVRGIFSGGINHHEFRPVRVSHDREVVFFGAQRRIKGTSEILDAVGSTTVLNLASPEIRKAASICRARVFVSACWHEGFNFGPLQAMACGLPVVMTADDFSPAYAHHGENVWIAPAHDVGALRKGIETVLSDSRLRMKLIENGLETAARYEWDTAANEFARFVDSLYTGSGREAVAA